MSDDQDDLSPRRNELRLLRAQIEAIRVLADDMRADAVPGEAAALCGIDAVLAATLDEDGLLTVDRKARSRHV